MVNLKFNRWVVFLGMGLFWLGISWANTDPLVMLKNLTSSVLLELDKSIALPKEEKELFIYKVVNQKAVPYFALEDMAKVVVGREAWHKASLEIRRSFVQAFKHYVISTYTSALGSYDGKQKIHFYPIRGTYTDQVIVSSGLELDNGTVLQIQYNLNKTKDSWVIRDFSVDGVSLVKNYHAQFAGVLRTEGLSGLLKQIKARNAK